MGAISTSAPVDRWDFSALGLSDGDPIGSVTNAGSSGNGATQSTSGSKPTFKTGIAPSGLSVARFDGGDYMTAASARSAAAQSYFVVVKISGSSGDRTILGGEGGAGGLQLRVENSSNLPRMIRQGISDIGTSSTALTVGTFAILAITLNGSAGAFYLNGSAAGTTGGATPLAGNTSSIGSNGSSGGEKFIGDIGELLAWERVLTSTELTDIYNELAAKWISTGGTPVSLTGVTADVQVAAPAGTVATRLALTGATANVQVSAPAGTVTAGTSSTPVSLTGVTANVQISAPAGTVAVATVGAVALTGVTADVQITALAGSVVTSYVEWEQLESYTAAWATIREQLTVTIDPRTQRPGYSLKVVDMQGDVLCELTEASIGTATRTLNGRGGLDFVLPKLSNEVANVQQFSEVQLWRGGNLVPGGWFVVVDPAIEVDAHAVQFQCSGLSYYFERRIIGGDRPELLLNGGFEQGARFWNFGWTAGSTSGRAPGHLLTRDACEGGKALVVYGDSDGHRQYAWQGFTYTNTHPTEPLWIDIQAQCRIDDYDGQAKDEWMLYADVRPSSGSTTILFADSVRIDETTPRDVWIPSSVRVKIAPNTTAWVQVRLYPPHGRASFDQVSAKADTALTIRRRDPWQAMQALVEEAQNVDNGKSDLNIYTAGYWSNFKIDRTFQWKDRVRVSEAMDEIVRSRNGPDANMEVRARMRRLTVAPKQGANNGRILVLALGDAAGDARIVSYSAGIDGDEVATTAIVQSSWSGGGMTEVITTSPRDDGLVLEKLYQAEQDTPTSTLLEQGRTAVKYGRADVITRVVMHPDDTTTLMQQLTIGEVVTLDVHDGEVEVRANYRIVQIDLDPNADQLTYSVVPEV